MSVVNNMYFKFRDRDIIRRIKRNSLPEDVEVTLRIEEWFIISRYDWGRSEASGFNLRIRKKR